MRAVPTPLARYLGPPTTALGWWSIAFELMFLVAIAGLVVLLELAPGAPLPFLDHPLLATVWLLTAGVGAAVAATAAVAILQRGERSIHDVFSLALGAGVLWYALGAILQHA
jgi:hypothetical protein